MKARKFETVVLRFKFQRFSSIPQFIRQTNRMGTRNPSPSSAGEEAIEATKGVSAVQLLLDLEAASYSLIDAKCEEFLATGTKYFIVQYIFAKKSKEAPTERFLRLRACIKMELFSICSDALWEAEVYINPCTKANGTPAAVKRWAHIVFCGRQPFFEGGDDPRPVMVWQKDELGERVGDAPLPLAPSYHLRTLDKAGFILMKAA